MLSSTPPTSSTPQHVSMETYWREVRSIEEEKEGEEEEEEERKSIDGKFSCVPSALGLCPKP